MNDRISFSSDYTKGAHPKILERLSQTNFEQKDGYGTDEYCRSAAEKIKSLCKCPDADVFFLTGGTQANQTIIDILLKPYEGVIASKTGHVAAHEAGAIEFSGHKVLAIAGTEPEPPEDGCVVYSDRIGKIQAAYIRAFIETFYSDDNHEHMVFPGAVYISHPAEYGTLYSKSELKGISEVCREFNIPLFIDGARLGYGLMSKRTDVSIQDIAELADVFYIGGTKVGALFGEAVVFPKGVPAKHPIPIIKQHGALLAKGWLLGLQFDTLFTDDLYFKISRNAIEMAELLRKGLIEKGCRLFIDSPTNQQFIVMENSKLKAFSEHVRYGFWEKFDEDHTVIRLAADWATTEEDIKMLMNYL
ncbi:MAG: low specificity L-threonine aldolase [Lachnospiraceae bacterium]|nr:low specificity L-threonine aldolase [Lachnospiraceae bacterium]